MQGIDHHHSDPRSVRCGIITVSDTRTVETDASGKAIRELLHDHNHTVAHYEIVTDDAFALQKRVRDLCEAQTVQALILTGGTGIAPRDSTIEAIEPLLDKKLDGFGELFRMLSYQQVGASAMLSRANAGVCAKTVVFALPGSTPAVKLATESLILPQIAHIAGLLSPCP